MGNASLLFALAAIFSLTVASSHQNITFLETEDVQADYEEQVLAREIATSWLSVEAVRLKNDFEGHRLSKLDAAYNNGFYDVDITQTGDGPCTRCHQRFLRRCWLPVRCGLCKRAVNRASPRIFCLCHSRWR